MAPKSRTFSQTRTRRLRIVTGVVGSLIVGTLVLGSISTGML